MRAVAPINRTQAIEKREQTLSDDDDDIPPDLEETETEENASVKPKRAPAARQPDADAASSGRKSHLMRTAVRPGATTLGVTMNPNRAAQHLREYQRS